MAWPDSMPIVKIAWIDSHSAPGWRTTEEWDKEFSSSDALHCVSVGYLFREDSEQIILAQSRAACGLVGELISIPKVAELSRRVLAEAEC